jgi:uncharacterized membrane protein
MSRISRYTATGEAERGRVRIAWAIDFVVGVVIAMLGFPFPIVRASVSTLVFVLLILAAILLVTYLYITVVTKLLGRTVGMYFMDLGFEGGGPSIGRACRTARAHRLTGRLSAKTGKRLSAKTGDRPG